MSEKFTESFEQFSGSLGTTDLLLYAGIALVLWYMFKDKMGGIKNMILSFVGNIQQSASSVVNSTPTTPISYKPTSFTAEDADVFYQLIDSWKRTRDLAVKSGCPEAVKVADQMFPFLGPTACNKGEVK